MSAKKLLSSLFVAGGMLMATGSALAQELPQPPEGADDPLVTLEANVPGRLEIAYRPLTGGTYQIADASVATNVELYGMDAHSNMERIHVIMVGFPLQLTRNGLNFYLPYTMELRNTDSSVITGKAIGALPDYVWRTDDFLGLGGTGGVGAGWFGFDDRKLGLVVDAHPRARQGTYNGNIIFWIQAD